MAKSNTPGELNDVQLRAISPSDGGNSNLSNSKMPLPQWAGILISTLFIATIGLTIAVAVLSVDDPEGFYWRRKILPAASDERDTAQDPRLQPPGQETGSRLRELQRAARHSEERGWTRART